MLKPLVAEIERHWIVFLRYPAEALASTASFTILFYAILQGVEHAAGGPLVLGTGLQGLIVGFTLWYLAVMALGSMAWGIQGELQMGTLEQVFLSPFGSRRILLARVVAAATLNLAHSFVLLVALLLLTGRTLFISAVVLIPSIPFLMGINGLGFVLAGLALLYKRIIGLINLSQYLVILLITVPAGVWPNALPLWSWLLPVVPSVRAVHDVMARGTSVLTAPIIPVVINGMGYLVLGLLFYGWAEKAVRRQGSLGAY